MKIMAFGLIISWEIDWETVETVSDFNFGGSKISADGDCSHEIKRRLLLGRKVQFSSVAQSCPTLCDPKDTRLLCPWDFLGKSTGVGCHFLLHDKRHFKKFKYLNTRLRKLFKILI